MDLLIGLGNPGPKHARERHNVGFMAIDTIARAHGFSRPRRRFKSEKFQGEIGGQEFLALRPLTWMNLSGEAVNAACRYHRIAPEAVTVIHDEIDLAAGRIRVKRGGGNAGHRGLASIDRHIGTNYRRVRIGVGRPPGANGAVGHVLKSFSRADHQWLNLLLDAIAEAMPLLAAGEDDRFMNKVAVLAPPPGSETKTSPSGKN